MGRRIFSLILTLLTLASQQAWADVKSSKANAYTILAPPPGVFTSKANAYTVLAPPPGVFTSKALAYAVLKPAVIKQPTVFIMTQSGTRGETALRFSDLLCKNSE